MINTFMLIDRLTHVRDMTNAVLEDISHGMNGDEAVEKHFDSLVLASAHLAVIEKDGVANRIEKDK